MPHENIFLDVTYIRKRTYCIPILLQTRYLRITFNYILIFNMGLRVPRALVVILNKDNAEGLRRCLESLKEQTCRICECFDVLVIDGGSKDDSLNVVKNYASQYSCIKCIIQKVKGGVGPARIEAVEYALDKGYEVIIWGDSENVYDRDYVKKVLRRINEGCDIVSGRSLIDVSSSLWSKLFYWYHSLHLFMDYLKRIHAPGNNKAVRSSIYKYLVYPPCSRSDDYYFTYLLMKKGLINNIRVCYDEDAILITSIPKTFKDILKWQKARVKGLIEGALILKEPLPIDTYVWLLYAISPFIVLSLFLTGHLTLFEISVTLIAMTFTYLLYVMLKLLLKHKVAVFSGSRMLLASIFLGIIGTYLHALMTLYYILRFLVCISVIREDVMNRVAQVNSLFSYIIRNLKYVKKDIFTYRG